MLEFTEATCSGWESRYGHMYMASNSVTGACSCHGNQSTADLKKGCDDAGAGQQSGETGSGSGIEVACGNRARGGIPRVVSSAFK